MSPDDVCVALSSRLEQYSSDSVDRKLCDILVHCPEFCPEKGHRLHHVFLMMNLWLENEIYIRMHCLDKCVRGSVLM